MAVRFPVMIAISAIDDVTAKTKHITTGIRKSFAPLVLLQKHVNGLARAAGLPELGKGFHELGDKIGEVGSRARETVLRLAEIPGIGGLALYELVKSYAEAGAGALRAATKIGISIETLQEYRYAARLAHVESEDLDGALVKLSRGLGQAARGGGKAVLALDRLQISIYDAEGRLRGVDDLLPEIADKLNMVRDQGRRTADVMDIFGRGGAALLPMLSKGSKGLRAAGLEARRLGIVLDREAAEKAEQFELSLIRVGAALEGTRNRIAQALLPSIEKLANRLQAWIEKNGPAVKKWAEEFAEKLPGRLERLEAAIMRFWEGLAPVRSAVSKLADTFGALNVAMVAIGAYIFGPLILSFVSLVPPLVKIGTVLLTQTIPALATFAGVALTAASEAVVVLSTRIVALLIPAWYALGVAFETNPLGWVLTAIALVILLVAALVYLAVHWRETFAAWVGQLLFLRAAFELVVRLVTRAVHGLIDLVDPLLEKWGPVGRFFETLLGGIAATFDSVWGGILDKIKLLTDWLPRLATKLLLPEVAGGGTPGAEQPTREGILSRLAGGAAALVQTPAKGGEAHIKVDFQNLPPGARVTTESARGSDVDLSLGYAMRSP